METRHCDLTGVLLNPSINAKTDSGLTEPVESTELVGVSKSQNCGTIAEVCSQYEPARPGVEEIEEITEDAVDNHRLYWRSLGGATMMGVASVLIPALGNVFMFAAGICLVSAVFAMGMSLLRPKR